MTLPSVSPGGIRVAERRESLTTAKSVSIRCTACGKVGVVNFITRGTLEERQALIRAFANEHRVIGCPMGDTAEGRKYEILYPRA